MDNEYRIETVADFLKLDEDQFMRIAKDFCLFYFAYKDVIKTNPNGEGLVNTFIWHGDGKNDFLGVVSDEKYPIGEDWKQKSTDLPEKTIESKGCIDCPFQNDGYRCNLNSQILIEDHQFDKTTPVECPLLTHSIKVVKS